MVELALNVADYIDAARRSEDAAEKKEHHQDGGEEEGGQRRRGEGRPSEDVPDLGYSDDSDDGGKDDVEPEAVEGAVAEHSDLRYVQLQRPTRLAKYKMLKKDFQVPSRLKPPEFLEFWTEDRRKTYDALATDPVLALLTILQTHSIKVEQLFSYMSKQTSLNSAPPDLPSHISRAGRRTEPSAEAEHVEHARCADVQSAGRAVP